MLLLRRPPRPLRTLLLLRSGFSATPSRSYSLTPPPPPPPSPANEPPPPLIHLHLPPPSGPGHIHLLLLHSPSTRNALSTRLLTQLTASLTHIQRSPPSLSRGLILASTSPTSTFCAGADLKERATFTPEQTTSFLTSLRATFSLLDSLPTPTIAAINGPALGGGLEMSLCADFRVLGPRATVGLPETRLGIIPGAGGTYRLPRLIGEASALDMILTGRRLSGVESLRLGLASRYISPETAALLPRDTDADDSGVYTCLKEGLASAGVEAAWDPALLGAVELMREVCSGGPVAVRTAKEAVKGWRGGEECENRMYERVVGTKDRDEALRAFREKRKPVFRGE